MRRKTLVKTLVVVAGLVLMSAPNILADVCVCDFDYDGNVYPSDLSVFLGEYGRTDCPPNGPAPVPKTGQNNSYGVPGSDGDLLRGVGWPVPRFTDNEDGTITDNLTGLIWLKNANCYGMREWSTAITDCHNLGAPDCGLTDGSSTGDWRLPNRSELLSLINLKFWNPPLSNGWGTGQWIHGDPFINLVTTGYWTSTSTAFGSDQAWYVSMYNGTATYFSTSGSVSYFWPVRGG